MPHPSLNIARERVRLAEDELHDARTIRDKEIRQALKDGMSKAAVAREAGVSRQTVYNIPKEKR